MTFYFLMTFVDFWVGLSRWEYDLYLHESFKLYKLLIVKYSCRDTGDKDKDIRYVSDMIN